MCESRACISFLIAVTRHLARCDFREEALSEREGMAEAACTEVALPPLKEAEGTGSGTRLHNIPGLGSVTPFFQ